MSVLSPAAAPLAQAPGGHLICHEKPEHAAAIEHLLDAAFGPGRHAKTSYRYRQDGPPLAELCLIALDDSGRLAGTVRHWTVGIAGPTSDPVARQALLLGPIAVRPGLTGSGLGSALMHTAIASARELGHRLIVLVGDAAYYGRFGFGPAADLGLVMPGENPERLLALPLAPCDANAVSGTLVPLAGGCLRPLTGTADAA
ncbi:GNAT family N-acetyltransferase [Roseospirillum parvum]|uniref:Predicted N-acetyltransferase YhbS n=1 Tax=Roseospirillum parvum TaxID=83401 RepID=A0A1G8D5J0_9PROT|nr:N-acetyltransferase [Roseospirillum parvum]SDH52972.1 Predicted N-acetyltransferase YhbS [Roseospirillum parvum]